MDKPEPEHEEGKAASDESGIATGVMPQKLSFAQERSAFQMDSSSIERHDAPDTIRTESMNVQNFSG